MKIVVCIKQIKYLCYPIGIFNSDDHLDRDTSALMINPYDEFAIEEAIRIKDKGANCEIIVLTLGYKETEVALRYAFAFGADRMIRINYESFDPWITSVILARVINKLDAKIVLCGKKAIDNNGNQVVQSMAELLKCQMVAGVVKINIFPETNNAIVERKIGRGNRQVIDCKLPAVFGVDKGINKPRYPTLTNRHLAEAKNVEIVDVDTLKISLSEMRDLTKSMTVEPPRPNPKNIFTPDSKLSASERMKQIMTGTSEKKQGKLFDGKASNTSDEIIEILVKENVIKK